MTATTTHILVIPDWTPPTLNALTRGRIRQRIRLGKESRAAFLVYARLADIPRATGKRRVRLIATYPKGRRFPDVDSLWKATLDGLVKCGMLRGDSPRWCELAPVEYVRGGVGERRTVVELEEVEA